MSDFSVGIKLAADASSLSSELQKSEAKLNEFRVSAEAAGKKMEGAFVGAERGLAQVGSAVAGLSRSVIGIGAAFAGAFVGGLAVGAFVDGLQSAIDATGKLVDTADQLGVTIEALQELRFAASQSGVGAAELDQALLKLQTRIGEFNRGDQTAIDAFTRLGLAGALSSGQLGNAGDTFEAVAAKIAVMSSQADAAAAAAQIFGDDFGPKLLNLLRQGSDGIDDLRDKARELGIVMSDETARAAEDAGDKLEQLGFVLKAKVMGAFVELAPEVGAVADALIAALPAVLDWVAAWSEWLGLLERAPDRALKVVNDRIAELHQQMSDGSLSFAERKNAERELAELEKRKAELEAQIQKREQEKNRVSPGERDGGPKSGEVPKSAVPQPFVPVPQAKDEEAAVRISDRWAQAAEREAEKQKRLAEQAENERQRIDQKRLAAVEKQQREEIQAARESFRIQVEYADALADYLQQKYEEERRAREEAMATDPFAGLLGGLADYAKEATALGDQIRNTVVDAFQGAEDALVEFVTTGKLSVEDLAKTIEEDLARSAIRQLTGQLSKSLFNALGGQSYEPQPTASAMGNVFVDGAIRPFAAGGVVDRPTMFPMATGGAGLMGEAGAEAIMPLRRDASGRLGVASSGGGGDVNVTVVDQRGAGSPPVEVSRKGSGRDLQILLKGQMERAVGSGDLDRVMATRFGLRPNGR